MKCKCVEDGHGHSGYCNTEVTFEDSLPINYYVEEKKYSEDDKGNRIIIAENVKDVDKKRCCNDCYDKIKYEAISSLKIDKEIEKHPLGAGFIQKDIKVSKGCEVCGEHIDAVKRKDGINVCDRCNYKYP